MVNKVFLLGRLGKDPQIKTFSNDNAIAEFTLATDDSYRDKQGNRVEQTDWHNVKLPFKWQAEIAEKYLKKGSLVHIEGKIKTRSYDDKEGNKRYVTEVVAESFKILDKRDNASGESNARQQSQESPVSTGNAPESGTSSFEDDLPF